jgi:large subunit ribosomal protein L31
MKKDIHPAYNPVVFVDTGAGAEFVTRSTMKSKEVRKIDGVDHFVIRLDVSSASHPFYTGKQRFVDAAGRIDKFRTKYGSSYAAKGKKADAAAPAAADAPKAK